MAIKFAPKSEPTPVDKKVPQPAEKLAEDVSVDATPAKKAAQPKARKPAKQAVEKDDELF